MFLAGRQLVSKGRINKLIHIHLGGVMTGYLFCHLKDARKTKHTRNVFWVAIAQFSHFFMQETAPFAFYNWVAYGNPVKINVETMCQN